MVRLQTSGAAHKPAHLSLHTRSPESAYLPARISSDLHMGSAHPIGVGDMCS